MAQRKLFRLFQTLGRNFLPFPDPSLSGPVAPPGFVFLLGADGAQLLGADGAPLYGVA